MSKKQEYLIIAGLLVLIFPFFALLFYVHPQGDDFFFAAKVNELGVFGFVKDMYLNWSGRYTAMFLGAIDPWINGGLILYRTSLFLFQIGFIISVFFLYYSIRPKKTSKTHILILTLSTYVVTINIIPNINEFLYWYPSVSSYQFGFSLLLVFMATWFYKERNVISNTLYLVINTILGIIIIGCVELFVVPIIVLSIFFIAKSYLKNKRGDYFLLAVLAVFSLITLLAPGNYERLNIYSSSISLVETSVLSIKYTLYIIGYFFQSTPFILGSILFAILSYYISKNKAFAQIDTISIHPLIFLLGSLLFLFALPFPAIYGLKQVISDRIANHVFLFAVIVWIINIFYFVNYYKNRIGFHANKYFIIPIVLLAILTIFNGGIIVNKFEYTYEKRNSSDIDGNILKGYYTLFYEANQFSIQMNNRHKLLNNAKQNNKSTIHITPFNIQAEILLHTKCESDNANGKLDKNYFYGERLFYNIDTIYCLKNNL